MPLYSHAPYFPIAILLPIAFGFKSNQLLPTNEAHSLSLRVEQFTAQATWHLLTRSLTRSKQAIHRIAKYNRSVYIYKYAHRSNHY